MQKHMYSELEFTDIFLTNPETTNTKSLQNVTSFFCFPSSLCSHQEEMRQRQAFTY